MGQEQNYETYQPRTRRKYSNANEEQYKADMCEFNK